jgi:hypothetical protein
MKEKCARTEVMSVRYRDTAVILLRNFAVGFDLIKVQQGLMEVMISIMIDDDIIWFNSDELSTGLLTLWLVQQRKCN